MEREGRLRIGPGASVLTILPQRRSRAALRSAQAETARTILTALALNLLVAAAKLAAGLLTGSAALLAEAGHSVADSVNEVLLGISVRRGHVPADIAHPLGHGRERFLWAFIAAIASFLIGGCVSIGLAVRELIEGGSADNLGVAWMVLVVAFVADGVSLLRSLWQVIREARQQRESPWRYVLHVSDPALRAVLVEDSAALLGVALAALGLVGSALVGNSMPDALASLVIGLLLAVTAFGLARPLADFLVGRSMSPEQLQRLYAIVSAAPAVEQVLALQAVYTGPEEVIVAAKVRPAPQLTIDGLTRAMDELDAALRAAVPEVADVYVDVTAYRSEAATTGSSTV
jgi:cation diffusion facilitator family transporter